MAANNMANPAISPDVEDELFQKEVEAVKAWWSDSRWRQTKRPFTAEQIVSKRGHLKIEYASNAQAKKLWKILENRFEVSRESQLAGLKRNWTANREDSRPVMLATPMAA